MEISKDISAKDIKKASRSLRNVLSELIIPIACVGASLLLIFLVIVPGIRRIREGREEKEKREALLAQLEEKNEVLSKYSARMAELDSDLELVRNAVPREEKIPELMTQLQDTAAEAGVAVSGLQYGGSKSGKKGETKSVRLQMSVAGDYGQMENLFKLFENSSRIVFLDQFGLQSQKEASMSANLGVRPFFFEAPDETKIDEPIERDFSSSAFQKIMERIENLKVYEVVVEQGEVGKENPFVE